MSPGASGPTPAGVPVAIRSPGSSVMTCETKETSARMENTMSGARPCWRCLPFTRQTTSSSSNRPGSTGTTRGPLQVPRGDVVDARDPGNARARLAFGGAPQQTSDDDADLALEVNLSRFGRQHERGAVSDHGRGRLEEQQRFGGHRISELGGVIPVIPPDPDDLARSRDAHERASSANVPTAASSSSSVL